MTPNSILSELIAYIILNQAALFIIVNYVIIIKMDDKLSKIVNNLQKEGVDDSAINDVVQKVKEYWSYIGNIDWNTIDYYNTLKVINRAKFLKARFNDETKFAIMNSIILAI